MYNDSIMYIKNEYVSALKICSNYNLSQEFRMARHCTSLDGMTGIYNSLDLPVILS